MPGTIHPKIADSLVLAELERVIASADFGTAARPARFLRHLVEACLRGETHTLKESLLGIEVFDRPPTWDPRVDPIVRQEASRLRKRLARYYQGQGNAFQIRIELPVGGYVPTFSEVSPVSHPVSNQVSQASPAPTPPRQRRWPIVMAAVAVALAGAATFLVTRPGSGLRRAKSPSEDLYLRGIYYWNKRTPESLNQAVDLFTQAIVRDPRYALAYTGLANSYNLLREFSVMPEAEAYPRALAATQAALKLDDRSAEAHASLAFISFWWNWNAAAADREFRRAISLDANYATAHHWYATFLSARSRFAEAVEQINLAQKLEPDSTSILADKGLVVFEAGRVEEAVALLRQLAAQDPAGQSSHRYLAWIYLVQRDYPNYLTEFRQYAQASKDPVKLAILAAAEKGFAADGAQQMFEKMLETEVALNREGKRPSYWLAETCGFMGRTADALRYLEKSSHETGSLFLAYRMDPAFESIRTDPGYRKLDAKFEPMIAAGTYPVHR